MILKSEDKIVEIIILQKSYPEAKEFEDANWLKCEIRIEVPGFKGIYGADLRIDDFERFYEEIEEVRLLHSKELKLVTMEDGIYLKGTLDIYGHIKWEGIARPSYGSSCLTFVIETDFASLENLSVQICDILKEYSVNGNRI
ncbi:hypothetical protein [Bacteroides acidifaciens]|uniref:WapI family immunity protein n=1 Tax=Bacteroides acidifaciens TaxID=85831 RepID=UPI0026EED555|nr:hypothetical protein [Bacteroides acidifaciens]